MLQNYQGYSHYRETSYNYEAFSKTLYAQSLVTDLLRAEVNILYLLNPAASSLQSRKHIEFYRDYFTANGGTLASVEPLEGSIS